MFEHHFLWCNHLPDTVEIISANSKCFLSHFTLAVAASDRHNCLENCQIEFSGIEFPSYISVEVHSRRQPIRQPKLYQKERKRMKQKCDESKKDDERLQSTNKIAYKICPRFCFVCVNGPYRSV